MSKDRPQRIGQIISIIARAERLHVAAELAPYGLGPSQFSFFASLLHGDGCSQDALARRVFMDKGTTARVVKSLEDAGLIRREPVPDNRRMNQLFVTEKGWALKDAVFGVLEETNARITSGFTDEERELLHKMLLRVGRNARLLMDEDESKGAK